MYQITSKIESAINDGVWQCEFICDTEADVTTLPTSTKAGTGGKDVYDNVVCEAGSSAYITDADAEYKLYILNSQDEWVPQGVSRGSSGGSSGDSNNSTGPCSWDEITDKPFGEVQSLNTVFDGVVDYTAYDDGSSGAWLMLDPTLTANAHVFVFDGVEYICEPYIGNASLLCFGNMALSPHAGDPDVDFGIEFVDNGLPFYYEPFSLTAYSCCFKIKDGETKEYPLVIKKINSEIIPLPEKYLPDHSHDVSWEDLGYKGQTQVEILPEQTISVWEDDGFAYATTFNRVPVKEGKVYNAIFDGLLYEGLVSYVHDNSNDYCTYYAISDTEKNFEIVYNSGMENDEQVIYPYALIVKDTSKSHSIQLIGIEQNVELLPAEFLPEHTHDVRWADLMDKPFGEEVEEFISGDPYDANNDNNIAKVSIGYTGNDSGMSKVYDDYYYICDRPLNEGETYVFVLSDGSEIEKTIEYSTNANYPGSCGIRLYSTVNKVDDAGYWLSAYSINVPNTKLDDKTFKSVGIYANTNLIHPIDDYISNRIPTKIVSIHKTELKTLDEKFIPDSVKNAGGSASKLTIRINFVYSEEDGYMPTLDESIDFQTIKEQFDSEKYDFQFEVFHPGGTDEVGYTSYTTMYSVSYLENGKHSDPETEEYITSNGFRFGIRYVVPQESIYEKTILLEVWEDGYTVCEEV